MKKNLKQRKLTLDVATIRKLDHSDLAAAAGGLAYLTIAICFNSAKCP